MNKIPPYAMIRLEFKTPIPLTGTRKIFEWLRENGLDKSTNRQYKNGKLVALVFDRASDAMMFKLVHGGS